MAFYKLNLCKGNMDVSEADNGNRRYHAVIGYADYFWIEEITDIDHVFSYNASVGSDDSKSLRETLLFTDFHLETVGKLLTNDEAKIKNHYFLTCPIKLNFKFSESLQEELSKFIEDIRNIAHGVGGIDDLQIFLSTGSFDLVLICISHSIEAFQHLILGLRSSNLCSALTFFYSYSLDIDLTQFYREPYSAVTVQIKTKNNFSVELKNEIKEVFPSSEIKFLSGALNTDLSIRFNHVRFSELIPFLTPEVALVSEKLKTVVENWKDVILSTNSYVYYELGDEHIRKIHFPMCSISDEDKKKIADIKSLYIKTKKIIPEVSLYTFEVLLDVCENLIRTSNRHILGLRIAKILKQILTIINRYQNKIDDIAISKSVRDVGLILDLSLQSDSIHIDHIESDSLDSSSPLSKILFGYENILYTAIEAMKSKIDRDDNYSGILLFMTMGHSEKIDSSFYFRTEDNELDKLVSINLPNLQYYNYKQALPFLYHELGHFTGISRNAREFRNICFEESVLNHLAGLAFANLPEGHMNIKEVKIRIKDDIIKVWESTNIITSLSYDGHTLEKFKELVKNRIIKISDALVEFHDNSQGFVLLPEKVKNYSEYFSSSWHTYTYSFDYLDALDNIYNESHADIIMCLFSRMDSQAYLMCLYKYMMAKKVSRDGLDNLINPKSDPKFIYRVAGVVGALEYIKTGESTDFVKNIWLVFKNKLPLDVQKYYEGVYSFLVSSHEGLKPLIDYLKKIYEKFFDADLITDTIFPHYTVFDNADKIMYNFIENWYKNMSRWKD